ncbi:MAG: VF530 family protein [Marinilabiliales bacterium]|nr:VF530 family protein [Marinilabiliales bacterium]
MATIIKKDPTQRNNPLHGKTLETILNELVDFYGWPQMAYLIRINCFANDPSIKSSLTFLRRTPWARKKVEELYLETLEIKSKRSRP